MTTNISTIKNVNRDVIPCLADKVEESRLKIRSTIQRTHLLKRLFLPIKLILFQTTFKDFIAAQFKYQRAR